MFDEEPDGDPHGECAAEIQQLHAEIRELHVVRDALAAALNKEANVTEPKQIVGYMVHSGAVESAALYPTSQHAEAIDAAHRWNASITALVCAPGGPDAA